jgi:hypothetical protein
MNRAISFLIISTTSLLILSGGSAASTLSIDVEVDAPAIRIEEAGNGLFRVEAAGMRRTNYLEFPSLPYRVFSVLLPQGEEVSSFRLEGGSEIELAGSIPLALFEGELMTDGTLAGIHIPQGDLDGESQVFPAWEVRHVGTSGWRGYRIATFEVFPVRYNRSTGRLAAIEGMILVIETMPGDRESEARRQRHVEGFRKKSRDRVRKSVINPHAVSSYSFSDIVVEESSRAFLPSYMPGMEGSTVQYLIITNEEMEPEFQRLAEWKTQKGIPAVVRTVEWIEQNTRAGSDLAETVRNFIRDAYEKWGVEYVLLGGDTEVIPERFAYTTYYSGKFIPTDMYYECLDGTWNDDADSLWGEGFQTSSNRGDEADLYAEIFVGRLPAVSIIEASTLVDKTINYESPSDTLYKSDFLLLAEVISPAFYNPGDVIYTDGAEFLQSIHDAYLAPNPDITSIRLYENYPAYPGSMELTMAASLAQMDIGVNHVLHAGHGGKFNTSLGDGSILNSDADNLTNGSKVFSMYLLNCDNVAFDTDCIAESFLLNPDGGAFAVTGSSRSAFPTAARIYMNEYYKQLFDNDVVQLGKTRIKSREPFTPAAYAETSDRWMHLIFSYLGDPESNQYRGIPGQFDIIAPASVPFGHNEIVIGVESEGAPFDSAYVCLYKDDDDYQYGYTDAAGHVTFEDFLCRDLGTIIVTVTGLDHCVGTTSIDVDPSASSYLRVNNIVPSDDSGGNGDGVVDAGETVALMIELTNSGSITGEKLWAEITTSDPSITVNNGISVYPDIPAGGRELNNDSLSITIDPGVEDESPVEFLIEIFDSTGGYWTEQFAVEVHAPELELYINSMTDSIPYGDGDGSIVSGEQYLLRIGVKNFGTGAATGLQGKISSDELGVTIADSLAEYWELSSMETGYGDGFLVTEANMTVPNYFTFELTDVHGRVFSRSIELRRPGAPFGLTLDSSISPDQIHATWHGPDSLETLRYLVYYSTSPGGPYAQVSPDLLLHPIFRNRDLAFSTRYYVVITSIDSCGNVSSFSEEASTSTNPPQLAGWPCSVDEGSSSSPAVGDIDGDMHLDIVFGAGDIYVWDSRGYELLDGDNRPLTWGIFATEGSGYTAAIALADLDGVPGQEIIGASWDTREIYIFTHDGSILPGWPIATTDFCWASPVAGDFDGDGDLEIVTYDVDGTVYVWHHDGSELMDGDLNAGTNGPFFSAGLPSHGWHISTPALADMDNDGIVELIVAAPSDSIYVLNADGSRVAGWPVFIGDSGAGVGASPVVGDIDGDSYPEVIIQNQYARVLGLNHDGTAMTGWPRWINSNNFFAGSAALADLTGDGRLEVVIPSMNGYCYIFLYNGASMPGWPRAYSDGVPTESSPVIADINDDGSLDIILGAENGRISAWNLDGSYIAGFPIQLKSYVRGTPEIRDVDFDGDLELIASCWDENVYIWDLDGEYHYECVQWSGFHGNQYNSGWKELEVLTDASVTAWVYELTGSDLRLTWSVAGGDHEWNLYRRVGSDEFTIAAEGLRDDGSGNIVWTDRSVEEGLAYEYRLESTGGSDALETGRIEIPVSRARLYQNHPNPFNPSTTIVFTIPGESAARRDATLKVYDVRGALVKTLVNGTVTGGRHEVTWDGRNNRGIEVSSGVYFARFTAGETISVKKMILAR